MEITTQVSSTVAVHLVVDHLNKVALHSQVKAPQLDVPQVGFELQKSYQTAINGLNQPINNRLIIVSKNAASVENVLPQIQGSTAANFKKSTKKTSSQICCQRDGQTVQKVTGI